MRSWFYQYQCIAISRSFIHHALSLQTVFSLRNVSWCFIQSIWFVNSFEKNSASLFRCLYVWRWEMHRLFAMTIRWMLWTDSSPVRNIDASIIIKLELFIHTDTVVMAIIVTLWWLNLKIVCVSPTFLSLTITDSQFWFIRANWFTWPSIYSTKSFKNFRISWFMMDKSYYPPFLGVQVKQSNADPKFICQYCGALVYQPVQMNCCSVLLCKYCVLKASSKKYIPLKYFKLSLTFYHFILLN